MAYYEVSVIVDGAVDEVATIRSDNRDERRLNTFITSVEKEASRDGKETEVFIQFHDHSEDVDECVCAQYKQDGRPDYTFK